MGRSYAKGPHRRKACLILDAWALCQNNMGIGACAFYWDFWLRLGCIC